MSTNEEQEMWKISCIQLKISSITCTLVILCSQKKKTSLFFFKNALKSAAKSCDAWHLYSLVDWDGSYHNTLLLRMLENSFSLSRIHSLVFIYMVADVTAVAD
jgi:hypothetical protein